MLVSIITATYNSAATLNDCLQSVAKQTYQPIEHIIIDGASIDATVKVATAFPHVTTFISEKDKGIYDAMNKGIALAKGDIIGILNSDDFYINQEVVKEVVNLFHSSACDLVYADLQYVDRENTEKVVRTWKSGIMQPNSFLFGWMPPHPTLFVKRSVYEKFGTFTTQLRSAADYEFMLRVMYKGKCTAAYLPKIIIKMRDGGISNLSIKNRLKANNEDQKAWKLNKVTPYFFTFFLKPLRKIFQFIN